MQALRHPTATGRLAAAVGVATVVLLTAPGGQAHGSGVAQPPTDPGQGDGHGLPTTLPGGGQSGVNPSVTSPTLPPQASPVADQAVSLGAANGVTVQLPGTSTFLPLSRGAAVPVGTVIDATHGVVTLTSAKDSSTTQTGEFWGGVFRVDQTSGGEPATVLTLTGGDFSSCTPPSRSRLSVHSAGRHPSRRLWGRDNHGRFVTRGRSAVASVRGTEWLTQDTCAGTRVSVKRGAVVVRDLGRRRNVTLHAGKSYLARARRR